MKNNKTLVTIILVAIVSFSALIFSVYKIISNKKEIFYSNGYVSISDSENSEKIYFNEGTTYKNGYHEEIIFDNKDNQKKEASKYSFAFYDNKSITFLSDGVILDLNGISESFIPYYNIKSNYLIEYSGNKYVIHSNNDDVILDNFIGRINDQKYLVAGNNIKLKTNNSDELISGDYFEINFIDGETVKIDGRSFNIETINDNAYILVNDNIKIDLSNKAILINDEVKLHLNEIIIDNDSNIDINYEDITKINDKDQHTENGGNNKENENKIVNNDNKTENKDKKTKKDKIVETKYEVETVTDYKKVPYLELLTSAVTSKKISLEFNVIDEFRLINGPIVVNYKKMNDTDSEIQSYSYSNSNNIKFVADNLTSNSNYLVTITTSYIKDGNVFSNYVLFQRTFETNDIGITLDRDYITSDTIYYNILSAENSTYESGTLNVYDNNKNLVFSQMFNNNKSTQVIGATGLISNSKYTAKIEDLVFGAVTYLGEYTSRTDTTLKYNPFKDALFENQPQAIINKKDNNFKIDIGKVNDKDNTIQNVKYIIKQTNTDGETTEVKTVTKDIIDSFTLPFENPIQKHNSYYYETYITLNDNEKIEEYRLLDSNVFKLDAKQSPTMQFVSENITTHAIKGLIKVTDADNTITGRTYVKYVDTKGNAQNIDITLSHDNCSDESEKIICGNLDLIELKSNDIYTISLMGYIDLNDETIEPHDELIGSIKVNTSEALIVNVNMEYNDLMSNPDANRGEVLTILSEELFEVKLGFSVDLSLEKNQAIMNNMNYFEAYLYEGNGISNAPIGHMIVDSNTNIAEKYFDQSFINPDKAFVPVILTIKDFGLTVDDLRNMHLTDGYQIASTYTITLNNALSGGSEVEFEPTNYITFDIDPELLSLTSNYASITMDEILNNKSTAGDHYIETLDESTTIGLRLSPEYDNENYATGINYKIFDVTDPNNKKSVDIFYPLTNLEEGENPTLQIFFDNETYKDEETGINFFRRGRKYVAQMTVNLNLDSDINTTELVFPGSVQDITIPEPAVSETVTVKKQVPKINLFAYSSGVDSQNAQQFINYKYEIADDIDNALKDHNKIYYSINNGEFIDTLETKTISCTSSNGYDCFQISGLNDGEEYSVIIKPQLVENTEEYTLPETINVYTYEGYLDDVMIKYDLLQGEKGNKYNNLFVIGLSDDNEIVSTGMLNRVAYYHVIIECEGDTEACNGKSIDINYITDNKATAKIKTANAKYGSITYNNGEYLAKVDSCEEYGTCIYIDYSVLYNATSYGDIFKEFKNKTLKLKVSSIYDDGKIGYDASSDYYYAFQIKHPTSSITKDSDNNYLLLKGSIINYQSASALSGAYIYSKTSDSGMNYYSFVDDGNEKLTLKSAIDNNSVTINNYTLTKNGIIYNNKYPIVAKELKESKLKEDTEYKTIFDTSYFTIVPSLKIQTGLANTFDGIKMKLNPTGLNNADHDGKLYFEFYNENGTLEGGIRTVNTEIISTHSQEVDKSEGVYQLDFDKNSYYLDINNVKDKTGKTIDPSEYYYDYQNGTIIFDDSEFNKTIVVDYRISFNKLKANSTYTMKSYIMVNDKKVYLADSASSTYDNFEYTFTTQNIGGSVLSKPQFEIESYNDYTGREIILSYNIIDIMGISSVNHVLSNSLSEVYDIENYLPYSQNECFYIDSTGHTCFVKEKSGYVAKIKFKVDNNDENLIYDEDYEIQVKDSANNTGKLNVHLRALEYPTIKVEKASYKSDNNYYLRFTANINDSDRVIKDGVYNEYIKEFAEGKEYAVTGYDNETIVKIYEDEDNIISATYGNGKLKQDTAYNWYMKYKTYVNNKNASQLELDYLEPYLNYTLNDYGIAVGKYEFKINDDGSGKSTSMLRFGYATNFIEDPLDPNQEAYVAGIQYSIYSGDTIPGFSSQSGTMLFKDYEAGMCPSKAICSSNSIMYTSDETSSLKSSYYQINIKTDNLYPQNITAMYDITARFYIRGKITENLTSEQLCIDDSSSNIWVQTGETTGDCYKYTSDLQVNSNTQYKGGAK